MSAQASVSAIWIGLAAGGLGGGGVHAQSALDELQSPAAAGPPSAIGVIDFPWGDLPGQIVERRYRVEALRFKARDESGIDWPGSDEVMVEVVDSEGSTASDEIGDIDSGDTHDFLAARSCMVAVVPGEVALGRSSFCDIDDIGNPAPLSFHVEVWEKDWTPFGFCNIVPGLQAHWPPHCANDGSGDDFIGDAQLDFTAQELEATLPNVGDQLVETVVLFPCEDASVCTTDGWPDLVPDYSFTYRVTRVPDGLGFPQLELAEAMRRTGAASELEVVMAGLRALAAPDRPRIVDDEPIRPAAD